MCIRDRPHSDETIHVFPYFDSIYFDQSQLMLCQCIGGAISECDVNWDNSSDGYSYIYAAVCWKYDTFYNKLVHSPDHQVQFWNGFGFFHKPKHTQGLWKIAKKPNHIVKFGCGSVTRIAQFFQKIGYNFSKNCQKYKKIIRVTKKLKNYSLVPILWYMFCGTNNFFKKLF